MSKVYIKTFGCQMNMYDSSRIRDALGVLGYTQTEASVAISKLDQSLSVEDLIKGALKNMTLRF